jgi:hypothetical protein
LLRAVIGLVRLDEDDRLCLESLDRLEGQDLVLDGWKVGLKKDFTFYIDNTHIILIKK